MESALSYFNQLSSMGSMDGTRDGDRSKIKQELPSLVHLVPAY